MLIVFVQHLQLISCPPTVGYCVRQLFAQTNTFLCETIYTRMIARFVLFDSNQQGGAWRNAADSELKTVRHEHRKKCQFFCCFINEIVCGRSRDLCVCVCSVHSRLYINKNAELVLFAYYIYRLQAHNQHTPHTHEFKWSRLLFEIAAVLTQFVFF